MPFSTQGGAAETLASIWDSSSLSSLDSATQVQMLSPQPASREVPLPSVTPPGDMMTTKPGSATTEAHEGDLSDSGRTLRMQGEEESNGSLPAEESSPCRSGEVQTSPSPEVDSAIEDVSRREAIPVEAKLPGARWSSSSHQQGKADPRASEKATRPKAEGDSSCTTPKGHWLVGG